MGDASITANRQSGGVRRLVLSEPARLDYISQGLTDITGYTRDDLRDLFDDEYARIVHAEDRQAFLDFDAAMRRGETTRSTEYRIVRKDGAVVRVQDIMNSHAMPDGTMIGYSLVSVVGGAGSTGDTGGAGEADDADGIADTSAQPQGAQPGGFAPPAPGSPVAEQTGSNAANDAAEEDIPYGLVVYSHESRAVVSTNARFWQLLGSTGDEDALHRLMRANPESVIPAVDQARFQKAARHAKQSTEPVTFETHLWHTGGYLVEVAGWITYIPEGDTYRLALVDVTRERNRERQGRRELRIENFATIYDTLFLFDVQQQTALCYKYDGQAPFDTSGSIRIMLSDAIEHVIANICAEESRDAMRAFLSPLTHDGAAPGTSQVAIDARADLLEGAREHARRHTRLEFTATCCDQPESCEAMLIDAEAGAYFFGCRHFQAAEAARREADGTLPADALFGDDADEQGGTGGLHHYVLPSPESGLFAFTCLQGAARVHFANERGLKFLDGAAMPAAAVALDDLVSRTPLSPAAMDVLLSPGGEGWTLLKDERPGGDGLNWRCVAKRDVRADGAVTVFAFEIPPWVDDADVATPDDEAPEVVVKTFGYFDVFVDGKAVVFSSAKAKELLALLVDRRGGFVSANDAISYLWEDEAATPTVLARQRKVAMRMKNTLDEYGIGHIVNVDRGQRCLNVDAVKCDLFDYLAGEPGVKFPGTYLQNYSWGEITLGELLTTMPFHA